MTAPLRLPPGLHFDIDAATYHADPCPEPSLSSSVAIIGITKSMLHAKLAHPRLTPQPPDADPTRPKEIGTAAHKLVLGRGGDLVVIDATDYKKEASRSARANAYAQNKCPILQCDSDIAIKLGLAVEERLKGSGDHERFFKAPSEVVCIARDPSGAWLRILMDKFEDRGDSAVIWDIKTGEQSAEPGSIGRRISNMGMEVQAEFYRHVLALARPDLAGRITFRWLMIENDPPHESTICELDATGREIGRRKAVHAIELWQRCMTSGHFPGYPREHVIIEYPNYAEAQWLEREIAYAGNGNPPIDYRMAG